ncbi:MAG: NADH-quinone oxidoreductase subunit J [Campylobacter sp.]
MLEAVAFYIFSIASITCFAISVSSKNVLYAMSALAGGMIFISALFFLLGAEFLGVVQIIVYTGAVLVLYAFSMMFFDVSKDVDQNDKRAKFIFSMAIFSAVLLVLIFASPVVSGHLQETLSVLNKNESLNSLSNIEAIGILLFTKYLVVFELVAVMLLSAMVAAITLIHKDMDKGVADDNA